MNYAVKHQQIDKTETEYCVVHIVRLQCVGVGFIGRICLISLSSTSFPSGEAFQTSNKMICVYLLVIGVVLLVYKFYRSSINHARYFEDRNLKYTSALSGIQNLLVMFLGRGDFLKMTHRMYNAFPNEP